MSINPRLFGHLNCDWVKLARFVIRTFCLLRAVCLFRQMRVKLLVSNKVSEIVMVE
jgi:hypothetical protein